MRDLLRNLSGDLKHPWDLAGKFAAWIPRNIRPQIGPYTGVITALEKRQGDCAEMSAVFVALCRAAGNPRPAGVGAQSQLVGNPPEPTRTARGRWIPVHTACYFWFGWTGAHELVIQKGDRLRMPDRGGRFFRLQEDWMQWGGRRPAARYPAALTPQAADAGRRSRPRRAAKDQHRRVETRGQSSAGSLHAAVRAPHLVRGKECGRR